VVLVFSLTDGSTFVLYLVFKGFVTETAGSFSDIISLFVSLQTVMLLREAFFLNACDLLLPTPAQLQITFGGVAWGFFCGAVTVFCLSRMFNDAESGMTPFLFVSVRVRTHFDARRCSLR
jgi:hypothetical protein